MIELFKYTSLIEEKLTKQNKGNDVKNFDIGNIIVDSFLLGYISGGEKESLRKYDEFQRSLQVVQQLRYLLDINFLQQGKLEEIYNNVFINQQNIQDEYIIIESQLEQNDNFSQQQFPIQQYNFKNQNESSNQQQQTQSSQIQSQFQTFNQQEKQNSLNSSNFNNNQLENINKLSTNKPKNIKFQTQFPQFVPSQISFKQNQNNNNSQNSITLNKFSYNSNFPQQSAGQQQINEKGFAPIQFLQRPFQSQQSQIRFQCQPFKQQESLYNYPSQEQYQFPKNDAFIIKEMKQMRQSQIKTYNQNQQQELRKTQNIARIQQQFPPFSNFQMKVQQNQEQQMKQELDENQDLEQQSLILAQKLQQEFYQEDQQNFKFIFTKDCDICFAKLNLEEMMVLDCDHVFHLNCLNQTCLTQMQSRQFPIYCPKQDCKTPIIYNNLAQILDIANLERYQQLIFKSYIDSHGDEYSWCPTPDCQFVFISEGENHFQCPVCSKQYCLNCKAEFHNGQTCQQYMAYKNMSKEDRQFYQFVQGAKFKQCPKCKFWVEKNTGCNHMTCRCRFEFCYTCGQDYKSLCKCKDTQNVRMFPGFQNIQF